MKLFIVLAAVALSYGAKLDKTYLPPSHSQTSGGSGNFLQTPLSGSNEYQRSNGFGTRGPARNTFAPRGNDYVQSSNVFGQNGNRFPQGSNLAQDGNYGQTDNGVPQGSNLGPVGNFAQSNNFGNFEGRPERAQAAFERNAAILRQDSQNDGETYAYAFETENGIVAEENGVATNGVEAQGGFSYTGDDGQVYSIRYTADQNGFVPQGDHLPTPPPIPEEILKALEQNARDEAAGIYDDGSYDEAKYGSSDNGNYNVGNNFNGNSFNGNVNSVNGNLDGVANVGNDEDSVVTDNALFRNQGGLRNQGSRNQGSRNQGLRGQQNNGFQRTQAQAGVSNAYLPPFRGQIGRNGNRQNARNGYQY